MTTDLSDTTVSADLAIALARALRHGDPAPERRALEALIDEYYCAPQRMAPEERHRSTYRRLLEMVARIARSSSAPDHPETLLAIAERTAVVDTSLFIAALIHYGIILTIAEFDAHNPDARRWRAALENGAVASAFLGTELGTANSQLGPRVRAVFDPETREFVIDTPDVGALKFSNVAFTGQPKIAVVFARLFVADADCGVFAFIVPISDGAGPHQGISVSMPLEIPVTPFDYSLTRFDRVRVPFSAWLTDTASIDAHGVFHDPLGTPDARLLRTLVGPKYMLPFTAAGAAAAARAGAALALKFAAERPTMSRLGTRLPLLSYQTQQRALFGALATAFAATCLADDAGRAWCALMVSGPDPAGSSRITWAPWAPLNRVLATSKAFATAAAEQVNTTCRLRSGVAGLLSVSRITDYQGLGQVFNDAEGNNQLIALDAARALVEHPEIRQTPAWRGPTALDDPQWLIHLCRSREHQLVCELAEHTTGRSGEDEFDVWNPRLVAARTAGEAYGIRLAMESVVAAVESTQHSRAQSVLRDLAIVYGLDQVQRHAGWFVSRGLIEPARYPAVETTLSDICARLATYTTALITAFGAPQTATRSPMAARADWAAALAASVEWQE